MFAFGFYPKCLTPLGDSVSTYEYLQITLPRQYETAELTFSSLTLSCPQLLLAQGVVTVTNTLLFFLLDLSLVVFQFSGFN